MGKYLLKPKSLGGNVKVEFDLPNYTTKVDFENTTRIDTSGFC